VGKDKCKKSCWGNLKEREELEETVVDGIMLN
jgi:hypothetical protein